VKLISASFKNFRLLRDLELEFSHSEDKKLTVIRAENDTGKTTILTGLQWALFGDDALPNKGKDFRLHPIDWPTNESKRVPVVVTVDFEVITTHRSIETRRRYRVIRSCVEELTQNTWLRGQSSVSLYRFTDSGTIPLDSPESTIVDEFPPELRDVFFTDGDRALSYIEADINIKSKRDKVQKAIRSLLGLGIIENSIKHVTKTGQEINKNARSLGCSDEIGRVTTKISELEEELEKLETNIDDSESQFQTFDEKLVEVEKAISAALVKGDKEQLNHESQRAKKDIDQLDQRISAAEKEHSQLFKSQSLAKELLAPIAKVASKILSDMHDSGQIPNATIPVLEERLRGGVCICGEIINEVTPEAKARKSYIEGLIETSRKADSIKGIITDLYYASKPLLHFNSDSEWREQYRKVFDDRESLKRSRDEAGQRYRSIEVKISSLPDTDIQALRETKRQYKEQRDRFLAAKSTHETLKNGVVNTLKNLKDTRASLLKEKDKGRKFLADLQVTQDILKVLNGAFDQVTHQELGKVSNLMNSLFLEMIGVDPSQNAIIRRAEISSEFDIKVYGPHDRALNPDRDLNGASRRALTLAFILALTKVSGVEAPNVIDTPLGMTSGYVKRSIVKVAIRECSQLILFLTRSEIATCEDIIDQHAGVVTTLTNPAHYPKMLFNNPHIPIAKVLKCECNHRKECTLCARRLDEEIMNGQREELASA
jgi:DNA sulfur modification protein DndD